MSRTKTLMSRGGTIAAFVLAADQAAKEFVRQHLLVCPAASPLHACDQLRVVGSLILVRTENAGSAFGFLQGLWVWVLLAALGVAFIPIYARQLAKINWSAALAVGLQLGGALGNLLDRLLFGRVTDFIYIGGGLVFNLADVALAIGMVLAVVVLYSALFSSANRVSEITCF